MKVQTKPVPSRLWLDRIPLICGQNHLFEAKLDQKEDSNVHYGVFRAHVVCPYCGEVEDLWKMKLEFSEALKNLPCKWKSFVTEYDGSDETVSRFLQYVENNGYEPKFIWYNRRVSSADPHIVYVQAREK